LLQELHIKNLALIDENYIEFDKGLNVLTGETGAGKTILVEAMNLLLGERTDCLLIRTGCDEAYVEGTFVLEGGFKETMNQFGEFISAEDAQCVISRRISKEGKNKCYINGKLVPLQFLKQIGNILVDLHGQHAHQTILKSSTHIDFLDRYVGHELLDEKFKYIKDYNEFREMVSNLESLKEQTRERARKKELLCFQIEEIEKANLKLGEIEDLIKERDILKNAEKICEAVKMSHETLWGEPQFSVHDLLVKTEEALGRVSDYSLELAEVYQKIRNISFELEDLSHKLSDYLDGLQFEPNRLEEIEARLAEMYLLRKKYGDNIEEILDFMNKAQVELNSLMTSERNLGELELNIAGRKKELTEIARKLSGKRKRGAVRLEEEVVKHLTELNMPKVRFKVQIINESVDNQKEVIFATEDGFKLYLNGIDDVEFLISPNPGEPLKPLAKIASGGEISRIMLALKIVLAKVDSVSTLIFDEIDSGVGGRTAGFVGQKMNILSDTHQVICITHLPQIAAYANQHLLVFKKEVDNRMQTFVEALSFDDKIDEVARMLGGKGEPSELSKKHALELIQLAKE